MLSRRTLCALLCTLPLAAPAQFPDLDPPHFGELRAFNAPSYTLITQDEGTAKLLAKPMDGLKSKDADERLLTAALLIARYRTPKAGQTRTESIDADESKLILQTLADADWTARAPKVGFQMNPQNLFFRLGVTPKDGWNQPKDFKKLQEEAKKWLKDNADKYRISRYVDDQKAEK